MCISSLGNITGCILQASAVLTRSNTGGRFLNRRVLLWQTTVVMFNFKPPFSNYLSKQPERLQTTRTANQLDLYSSLFLPLLVIFTIFCPINQLALNTLSSFADIFKLSWHFEICFLIMARFFPVYSLISHAVTWFIRYLIENTTAINILYIYKTLFRKN